LVQLRREHDREIKKLEAELDKKTRSSREGIQTKPPKKTNVTKLNEKRRKLEAEADEAYPKFSEKVEEENRANLMRSAIR
jgi:hypothetical protein